MGNNIINENIIMNLTCLNFFWILLKETEDYFYSFFEKRIKQFSLIPGAKDYEKEGKLYSALKGKKKIYLLIYILKIFCNLTKVLELYFRYFKIHMKWLPIEKILLCI